MHRNVVIVVDDDLTILELLRYQITDAIGHFSDVELATSGAEVDDLLAGLIAQGKDLKVLVTDYFLDDCTGVDIIERVKNHYPMCSTVLLTGQHQRDIEKVANAPIVPDRYFSKPWNSFELKSHLINLITDIKN